MAMSKPDQIITELVNALGAIGRAARGQGKFDSDAAALAYIDGCAGQAITNCQAQQQRNRDGYFVTLDDGGAAFPSPGRPARIFTRGDRVIYEFDRGEHPAHGMSLRAHIATAICAAIYANGTGTDPVERATHAVTVADALIAALKGGRDVEG